MLVLSRKKHEGVVIKGRDGDVRIVLLDIDKGRVRMGIDAPKGQTIIREELVAQTMEVNRLSALDDLKKITTIIGDAGE